MAHRSPAISAPTASRSRVIAAERVDAPRLSVGVVEVGHLVEDGLHTPQSGPLPLSVAPSSPSTRGIVSRIDDAFNWNVPRVAGRRAR